jgi:hypothetical protein
LPIPQQHRRGGDFDDARAAYFIATPTIAYDPR